MDEGTKVQWSRGDLSRVRWWQSDRLGFKHRLQTVSSSPLPLSLSCLPFLCLCPFLSPPCPPSLTDVIQELHLVVFKSLHNTEILELLSLPSFLPSLPPPLTLSLSLSFFFSLKISGEKQHRSGKVAPWCHQELRPFYLLFFHLYQVASILSILRWLLWLQPFHLQEAGRRKD